MKKMRKSQKHLSIRFEIHIGGEYAFTWCSLVPDTRKRERLSKKEKWRSNGSSVQFTNNKTEQQEFEERRAAGLSPGRYLDAQIEYLLHCREIDRRKRKAASVR